MTKDQMKLKSSLNDVIDAWINEQAADHRGWSDMNSFFGRDTSERMTDAAFNILLSNQGLTDYLRQEGLLSA